MKDGLSLHVLSSTAAGIVATSKCLIEERVAHGLIVVLATQLCAPLPM